MHGRHVLPTFITCPGGQIVITTVKIRGKGHKVTTNDCPT